MDQHMLSHETERKFNCDICGKFFRNSSYLRTHRKACSGVKVCNFKLYALASLIFILYLYYASETEILLPSRRRSVLTVERNLLREQC